MRNFSRFHHRKMSIEYFPFGLFAGKTNKKQQQTNGMKINHSENSVYSIDCTKTIFHWHHTSLYRLRYLSRQWNCFIAHTLICIATSALIIIIFHCKLILLFLRHCLRPPTDRIFDIICCLVVVVTDLQTCIFLYKYIFVPYIIMLILSHSKFIHIALKSHKNHAITLL